MRNWVRVLVPLWILLGCTQSATTIAPGNYARIEPILTYPNKPHWTAPETCWTREVVQVRILSDAREDELEIQAEHANSVFLWSRFNPDARPQTHIEERLVWFATPCPDELTPEHIRTLQRALAVRGLFIGVETGELDEPTIQAIRAYQSARTLHSGRLARETLVQMGVVTAREREKWPELIPVEPPASSSEG